MIFVDTSFWVASGMTEDRHHQRAAALLREHQAKQLLTTTLVRGETWTFLRRQAGRAAAVDFLDRLERSPRLRVVPFPNDLEDQALGWLRERGEREYSYVDATSFVVMRRLRIRQALAFDGDFAAAGFTELK
ncbi:MAG TPA: type II toxin-antitoxin system VapC family toxin [Acidimicrobiia bacterium]|nr:type II toxin-antitoxin system VapC family toxin [Acidimicrobiia bacterium]